jgi:hypothetical protein
MFPRQSYAKIFLKPASFLITTITIMIRSIHLSLVMLLAIGASGLASSAEEQHVMRDRWMLVLCGLPGDASHRERLTDATLKIAAASDPVFSVPAERLRVMVGDQQTIDEVREAIPDATVCTRESIEVLLRDLGDHVQPDDSFWVIILGHAQLYGGRSTFNVSGPDFDATDFAHWMQPISAAEKIFMITTPVSGFWIKPLSGPGTVVITATEADREYTGTEMPYVLADILSGEQQDEPLKDVDGDGSLTLRDLYLAAAIEVHQRFRSLDRLKTEHALLDDNGDGVGREIQSPYLSDDEGEAAQRPPGLRSTDRAASLDGSLAATIGLTRPMAPQTPSENTDKENVSTLESP